MHSNLTTGSGVTTPESRQTSDVVTIGVMATIGARAVARASGNVEGDDSFTVNEMEEMIVVSVCNNLEKEEANV